MHVIIHLNYVTSFFFFLFFISCIEKEEPLFLGHE